MEGGGRSGWLFRGEDCWAAGPWTRHVSSSNEDGYENVPLPCAVTEQDGERAPISCAGEKTLTSSTLVRCCDWRQRRLRLLVSSCISAMVHRPYT